LAGAVQFEGGSARPSWKVALEAVVRKKLSDPVTISLEPLGESSYSADQLLESIVQYTSSVDALNVSLHNIGIKIDATSQRASVKGEAYIDEMTTSAGRRGEPRKFAATLENRTQGWVIIHLQISAPRLDQPEARP